MNKKIYIPYFALISLLLISCNNQWDDHIEIKDPTIEITLSAMIKETPELSIFHEMLVKTGYDSLLTDNNNEFTVFAPTNEVLSPYVNSDLNTLRFIIKNHIAYLSFNSSELETREKLTMINKKNIASTSLLSSMVKKDILCKNGILNLVNTVIEPKQNIYEYIASIEEGNYIEIDSLLGQTKKVMDTDRSIQIGVNENGQAIYDTVWITHNHFFEKMAINNEDSLYTFIVLTNNNFEAIKNKYKKYMKMESDIQTDSVATDELINDLIFKPNSSIALSGVYVDFSNATILTEYAASNGTVKIMNGVDIKLKDNKIKPIYIEGENYEEVLSQHTLVRLKDWAHGGKDVMVSSVTYQTRDSISPETGQTVTITYTFRYNSGLETTAVNFYLKYSKKLYSADYDIYWLAYDDIPVHVGTDGHPESVLKLEQKLFISLPDNPVLSRDSKGRIYNNYLGDNIAFVGVSTAGIKDESHLCKYTLDVVPNMYIKTPLTEDPYTFSVPRMGNTTFMVCNTARRAGGLIFLDYIKLVPRIDE